MALFKSSVDLYMLYQFVKRLSTPFTEWSMFKTGLIDADGNFLVAKDKRTDEQNASWSYYDLLVLNLKRLISKVPGGSTRIATLAAALYLLREKKPVINEEIVIDQDLYESYFLEIQNWLTEEGAVPANNMGDGQIANNPETLNKKKLLKRQPEIAPPK